MVHECIMLSQFYNIRKVFDYMCVQTFVCACVCVNMHVIDTKASVCMHVCVCVHVHVYVCVHVHVYVCVYVCLCVYACSCVCICVYTYVCVCVTFLSTRGVPLGSRGISAFNIGYSAGGNFSYSTGYDTITVYPSKLP